MTTTVPYSTCKQMVSPSAPSIDIDLSYFLDLKPVFAAETQHLLESPPLIETAVLWAAFLIIIIGVRRIKNHVYRVLFVSALIPVLLVGTLLLSGPWLASQYAKFHWQHDRYEQSIDGILWVTKVLEFLQKTPNQSASNYAETQLTQLDYVEAYVASAGILYHVRVQQTEKARLLANQMSRLDTSEIRSYAYMASAAEALTQHSETLAFNYAMKASEIHSSPEVQFFLNTVVSKYAIALASRGKTQDANVLFDRVPDAWPHQQFGVLAAYLARRHVEETLSSEIDEVTLEKAIVTTKNFHDRLIRVRSKTLPTVACDLAGLLEIKADFALLEHRPAIAIDALLQSEQLIESAPNIKKRIPEAYRELGVEYLERGDSHRAVSALSQAHSRVKTKASACDLSVALHHQSFDMAGDKRFASALDSLDRADALCEISSSLSLRGNIHLANGKYLMRAGHWQEAKQVLQAAYNVPETKALALGHLLSIDSSIQYLQRLRFTGSLGDTPNVTGQVCAEPDSQTNQGFCETLLLFNNERYLGWASSDFTEVVFDSGSGSLTILRDTDANARFDTWQHRTGNTSWVMFDQDNDFRPDWKLMYLNDKLVEEKSLSGRISIRVPSAVVGKKNVDIFSKPDAYFALWKNHVYLGRTSTHQNSSYPSWAYEAFVVDYRYRDSLTVRVYDEEIFVDEFIDVLQLDQLPETGFVTTQNQHVGLYVDVRPTDLPEGMHYSSPPEEFMLINPFNDPSFLEEQGALPDIIRHANEQDSRTQIMSLVGAAAGSEVSVFTLLKSASLLTKFAGSWIAFDLLYAALSESSNSLD